MPIKANATTSHRDRLLRARTHAWFPKNNRLDGPQPLPKHQSARAVLLAATGPAGFYLGYLLLFVVLPAHANNYSLAIRYTEPLLWMTGVAYLFAAVHSYRTFKRRATTHEVRAGIRDRDYLLVHGACVVLTLLSVWTVARSPNAGLDLVFENYAVFYALVRDGSSRYIYLLTLLLFICMFDLYVSRLTIRSIVRFLTLMPYFLFFGSRTFVIVMLCAVGYLVIARLEINWSTVFRLNTAALVVVCLFLILNNQRTNPEPTDAPDVDLDAAFILEDVIQAVGVADHRPALQSLEDFRWQLVPFALDGDRPRSTAETRAIYPEVAARGTGTNITFPLSANLYFNFGPFYMWLIPLLLIGAQYAFILSLTDSNPQSYRRFMSFMVATFFIVIARGGIINSRLLIPAVLMSAAFLAGQIVLRTPHQSEAEAQHG